MSHPAAPLPRTSTAKAIQPRPHLRQQAQNLLHLLTVLSLWLSTISPLLAAPQPALADAPAPVDRRAASPILSDASRARAPYRRGMEPATYASVLESASPQVTSSKLAPAWFTASVDVPLRAARPEVTLSPAWLTPLSAPEASSDGSSLEQADQNPPAPLFSAGTCAVPGLSIGAAVPPAVIQGNTTVPYTFTVVISNTDYLTPTGPLSLTLQVPNNFYYVGNMAGAQSQVSGTLAVVQPMIDQPAGKPVPIVVSAAPPTQTLPPGDVVTVTYRLAATTSGTPNPTIINTLAISGEPAACTAAAIVSTSSCPLPVRLPMQLQIPPYLVSFGNTAGDVYTFTVRNTGTTTATDVSFEIDPSQGFFFKDGSAALQHSSWGALTVSQPPADTTPGEPFVIAVSDAFPANSLAPNTTITGVLRLGTDGEAKSGQPLSVTLRSGTVVPQVCNSTRQNIPTGRGHLSIVKTPDVQLARFGDVVTWTVQVKNTGLGSVYDAVFDDIPDPGIRLLSVTPAVTTTAEIKPDQATVYTVTGAVNACTGLRNVGLGSWSIGNIDATGLVTNPIDDEAYVAYLFEDPGVAVSVEPIGDLQFCGQPQRSLVVTVTNTGGPARELILEVEKSGSFNLVPSSPDWIMAGSVLSYTANGGVLLGGETITFTLDVDFTAKVCDQNSGSFVLRPVFRHACPLGDPPETGTQAEVELQSPVAPSLDIAKRASTDVLGPGGTVFYTVTVAGRNPISTAIGPIHVTDTLPAIFQGGTIVRSDSETALQMADDAFVETWITPTTTPTYSVSLFVTATLPLNGVCAGGAPQINRAAAHAESCPECLAGGDSHILYIEDPAPGVGGGYFHVTSEQVAVCGRAPTEQTSAISITNGITWTGTVYRDNFNAGGVVGPLNLVDGSVRVIVDDIDRTADVTVTAAPTLTIEFDNIGVFSDTALITVTYQVTAGETAVAGKDAYFVTFTAGGHDDPAACGVTRAAPVLVNVERTAFSSLRIKPAILNACTTNNVVLTVDGNFPEAAITNQIVVTFSADAADIVTVTEPYLTLGGGFAGQPVTVTTATLGASQVVSFTFDPSLDLHESGSIAFALFRPCGITTTLSTLVRSANGCGVTSTRLVTGGLTTRQSDLYLRAPEITYTLNSRLLDWQFSVRNAGDMSATNVLVTNTLPYGVHYRAVQRTGVDTDVLDAIIVTTGTVNPGTPGEREVVSFTVPSFPPASSIQFIGSATVDTCSASDSLWIRLTQPCGGVGSTCGGSQMARLGVQQGRGALLTSNTQQATIPLCSAGDVRLIVKNASPQADLYDFFVQELLTDVTYAAGTAEVQLLRADGTASGFVPFTPTLISPVEPALPYRQTLQWDAAEMEDYDPAVRALLARRGPSDQLIIQFNVRTYCSSPAPSVQASVEAVNACTTVFRSKEDSRAVEVGRPILGLQKQVRNASEAGSYGGSVFAGQGDTLVWKVNVDNNSDVDVTALFVTDTLPAWFEVTDVYQAPTTNAPPILQWTIISDTGPNSPVPAQSSTTFWITGTVGAGACSAPQYNVVKSSYGCSEADICPASVYSAQAEVTTAPVLSLDAANVTLDQCSSGPLLLTFANTGARTGAVVVTYTLPAGYQYTGLAAGTTPIPPVHPALGAVGELVFGYDAISQQQVTNTLRISVTRDLAAPGACLNNATVTARLGYADTCGIWKGNAVQDTGKLNVLRPDLSGFTQTPVSQTVEAEVVYTWTLTAPNSGSGAAHNLVMTQTLPAGLEFVTATAGSVGAAVVTPSFATVDGTTVITWEVASLAAGQVLTAQVAARPLAARTAYSITSEVHAACDDGGCQQGAWSTGYNAPLQAFGKQAGQAEVSIGEPFVYTITADFFGSVPYTDTALVDTLPQLGERLVFSYTEIDISSTGAASWHADTSTPGVITFTTGSGTVDGPSSLTVRLAGVISNEVTAQQGDIFTNSLQLANYVDGQYFYYTDTVSAAVKEPILGITKAVAPPSGIRADSTVTYTLLITHLPASNATAYNVVITDAVPPSLALNPGSLAISAPAPGIITTSELGNNLAITVSEYPTPAAPIYITFTAAAGLALEPSSRYTNTAYVRYTSQPGDDPNDRDGSGAGPNDYWSSSSAAFDSTPITIAKGLLQNLDYTIGDLVTYTVWITLPTGTTRGLRVTDTVPAGLLYQAPTGTVAVEATPPIALAYVITPSTGSGTTASSAILSTTAPIANNTGAPAVITWTMRLLVVDDPNRTVNYNGAQKTNKVDALYANASGQLKTLTASAPAIRLFEPLLHIGKGYMTAQACSATLLGDNFNTNSVANWTIASPASPAWSASGGWLRAPSAVSTALIHGADTWSDISYSAIFSSTDTDGSVGLIFRAEDAANYYRFAWTRNAAGAGVYQVTKIVGGNAADDQVTDLGAGGGYITNRWYHLEIRTNNRQVAVFIDGRQVLTYTDNSEMPFLSGSVGFYAANENGLAYDDALVTKVGESGCMVSVNDLVTYTLTISNQERLVGHNLVISDVLPPLSLEYIDYAMASSDGAAVVTAAPAPGTLGTLVWNVDQLAPLTPFDPLKHGWLVLTVTARIVGDVSAGVRLPNQALLTYDGQAASGPDGVQRTYSGGSHSTGVRTPSVAMVKASSPSVVTIGQRLNYTLTLPAEGGLPATLYTATLTDSVPSGFRLVAPPQVSWSPNALAPADVDVSRSTTQTVLVDFTRIPSNTEVTVAITAVVENIAANQDGVRYTNTATLGWHDLGGSALPPQISNVVSTRLAEPNLVIEKVAAPKGVRPGDVVFYHIRVYHAPTSTVPAYNVVISDVVPAGLTYISGSWSRDNEPVDLAATGYYTEQSPRLAAWFPVISTTVDAANPLDLSFQAVVDLNAGLGSLITNAVTTTWQSLPTDPDGERRTGAGGIDDYIASGAASVSLDSFNLDKTGPLSATAGGLITYVVTLQNSSAVTGQNAIMRDSLPFQIAPITATFAAPLRSGACDPPFDQGGRPIFSCSLGDLPPYAGAVITLTGRIDPATPDGTLLDNYAVATLTDSNGALKVLSDEAETWVYTLADLQVKKSGPVSATAGATITYTIVVTNAGPSYAQGVDVKDALPPGITFVSGSASQGACVSAICQLGALAPGLPVTMVITGTVGPGVSGTVTNTGYVFAATADGNAANNSSAYSTTVSAATALRVAKIDFTDPAYAGSSYFYQILVTNTGPATALGVVVTDTLPAAASFESASPGCSYAGGRVTCQAGDMLPGSAYSFLINVAVPVTITNGTVVTNVATAATRTQLLTGTSVLTASEPTTWLQAAGSPTDLALTKVVTPVQVTAGGGAPITYTLTVTNNGPAPASAVQVTDLFPQAFQLLAIRASLPLTQAQCSSGGVCDLGALASGQAATITLVMQAPPNTAGGIYTNTAFVGSPAADSNPANNSGGAAVTVVPQVMLQASKVAAPNPAVAGEELSYVIFVTNTGPSNATNVMVADTLPSGFAPGLVVASQGACASLPCSLGTMLPGANAWVHIYGRVASTVTQASQIANTAVVTASEYPTGVIAAAAPGLSTNATFLLRKTQVAPAGTVDAGSLVTYTLRFTNTGPGLARSVDVKDQLPPGLSLETITAEGGVCAGPLCQFGNLPVDSSRTVTVVARIGPTVPAGVLTNTAAVFSPDAPVVTKTVTTTITTSAHLSAAKVALNTPVNAGEVAFFQLLVTNQGPSDAQAVIVTDTLPSGLTYAGGDAACIANGSQVVCTLGSLAAGSVRTLFIQGRSATTLTDGIQLTNSMTATSPTAAQAATAAAAIVVRQVAGTPVDLRLAKDGPATARAGETVRYILTVTNNGPVTATAVTVLDALPRGVDFAAAAAGQGLCTQGVACQLGDLPAGASTTVVVTGLVQSTVLTGTQVTNLAQVGSANSELTPADNQAAYTTTIQALALLSIAKSAAAANVLVGDLVQYRIVVANAGPSTARDVSVADLMPAGVAHPQVSSSRGGCTGFPCSLGDLEPGAKATIVVAGIAAAEGSFLNTAAVSSATDLDPASTLSSGVMINVNPFADLALHKDAAATVVAGSQVVYTLTVFNDGPSDAAYITVTDALPAQVAFTAAAPGCSVAGDVVTCLAATLGAGLTRTFAITATTAADLTPGSSIENRAIVAAATLDPVSANNLANADTSIIGQAVLALTKTDLADPVVAGGLVTYTIAVTNSGPSIARAVDVADQWPLGMSLVAIAASGGGQCAQGVCRFGTLAAGATRTVTITLRVAPGVPAGQLANVASAYSPDSAGTAGVPAVTETTTITTQANLRVTKAALNNPAIAGGQQSYQVVVSNDGPSDAQAVRVTDTLPAGTGYAGGAAECSAAGNVVTCDLGVIPAGSSRSLLINAVVAPATADGIELTNVVTAASPTAQEAPSASVATVVRQPQGGVVDLAVAKDATPHTTAGEGITYTLVVTNNGPAAAQNVQLVDALPLSVTILALSASQGTCAAGMVCQLGDLAPGAFATVQLTGVASAYAISGTLLVNAVQAGSSNVDADPLNNTAAATTTVDSRVLLTIDKEATVATVSPGGSLAYRISVHNGGPSLARTVVMTDLLPPQLLNPLLSSSRGSCGATACTLGDMPPGDTATILVLGTASFFAAGSIENRAVLTTTTALDPNSILNSAVTVLVGDTADLALVKTAVPSVYAGQTITYVLNAYNTGPSAAAGVQVVDQLPLSTTLVSLDPNCTAAAGAQVHCPAAPTALAANGQLSFTLVVATDAALATGTVLENQATVTSQTPDPNPVNNSATAGTTIIGQADLQIHKAADPGEVLAGENLTYTIVVTNAGPSNAATVRLVDTLPGAVAQVGPVVAQRSLSQVPVVCLNLVCELGAVPLGEVITLTLPVRVNPAVAGGTVFTNTATIYSPSDPDPRNNVGAAGATAYRQSALVIQKSAAPDPAITGADLLYTIQVLNRGPSDADGVTVTDVLPSGFVPDAVISSQGNCSQLPCVLGTLPPGAMASITIRGRVSPTQGGDLANTASVTATTPLTDIAASMTTITTSVTSSADLQLILRSTPTALAGMTATVYANLVNHGPSAAVGAAVTLTLPLSATFDSAQLPEGWTVAATAGGEVVLTTGQSLAPGIQVPLAVVVDLDPSIAPGSSVEFVGSVVSPTPDPTPSNNTAAADTSVLAQADFAISKQGPEWLPAGGLVTYTIAVHNGGPSTGMIRDIKDSLPPGMTLVAASLQGSGGPTACAGAICQTLRPLPVGEALTMTVVARVDAALVEGTLLTNRATVFPDAATPDPVEANNQADHTAPAVALAQIAVDKYDLLDPVYPDTLLAYVVAVANQGPSTAAGLIVTDVLPLGVTYMSSTAACAEGPAGVLTCDLGTLAAGAHTGFQVMVHVGAAVPNGAVLHNTVTLTSTTPLTQSVLSADEDTRVLVPSGPLADLEVVKTVAAPVVQPGDLLTFTLAVTNNGPSPVNSAQLLDLLPDGLQLIRVTPSQGYCNAGISCLLGTLNYISSTEGAVLRGTAVVTVLVRVSPDTLDQRVLTNTAFVQSERQDPVPENNLASAEVTVLPGTPIADLQIEKKDEIGVSTAGGLITYTLRVYNAGPSPAANVMVTDPLPAGLTYVTAEPPPSGGSPSVPAWSLGTMPAGTLASVLLVVRSDAAALAGLLIRNTAIVTATTQDPVPQNNAATAESQVFGAVDLEVRKSAVPTVVLAGESITYVITVTNHGPSAAQDVDVKEQLPPSTTLTALTPSRGVCVSQICQFGAMTAGEEIVITATVQADAGLLPGTVLNNTAAGFTDTPDRDPGNNEGKAPIIVGPLVNIEVAKLAKVMTATVGTEITYTMIVTNLGPSLSPNVILTDVVPGGFAYLRTTNPGGCARLNRWYVTCPLGSMAAGQSLTIDIVFFIEFVRPGSVTNRVVVLDPSAYHPEGEAQGESVLPSDPKGPTAVNLERFDVTVVENALVITWQTVHELDTWSFQLFRNTINDRETAELITPQPILSHGSGSIYSYTDTQVIPKQLYYYWLQELGASGILKEIDRIQGGIDLAPAPKLYLPCVKGGVTP
ncbi:MAG: hypothetical protein U0X20_05890 [Caldilineaceae bacterium]